VKHIPEHDFWRLELPDLIRMNQLVRGRVDVAGFAAWYAQLTPAQQAWLAFFLCEFAHEAGATVAVCLEAAAAAGLSPDHHVVSQFQALHLIGGTWSQADWFGLAEWLRGLTDDDRGRVFMWFLWMLGLAEGRRYDAETEEGCNHWWHRDLLDRRVVRDLLRDPEYWRTSMKDDRYLKATRIARLWMRLRRR
jgi:hypothetical protein